MEKQFKEVIFHTELPEKGYMNEAPGKDLEGQVFSR